MKIKTMLMIVVLVAIILIVMVMLLPVNQLIPKKEHNNRIEKLTFTDISGYWWSGEITNIHVVHRGYRMYLGDVHWQYDWSTLLSARWCADINNVGLERAITFNSRACYHWIDKRASIHQTALAVDAKVVSQLTGLEAKGQWLVNISQAEWLYTLSSLEVQNLYGEAVWKNAQWHNGEQWIKLGEILSTIDSKTASVFELNTIDVDGPLEIDIKTIVSQQQVTSIVGYVEPYAAITSSLSDSLSLTSSHTVGARYYYDYRW
ncbi:MAG: hypothetical protein ACJA2B_001204 [Candidatus Endobugula sp.]|jgi:hypothetical protein